MRVETPADLKQAILEQAWDVVLADYQLPQFNAPAALKILQAHDVDIPFIILSGSVGEDVAVAAMKAGAHDFFPKDRLTRLVPAVEREIREAAGRNARRMAEQQLQLKAAYDELLREIAVHANVASSLDEILQFTVTSICANTSFRVGHVFVAASERSIEFVSSGIWDLAESQHYSELRAATETSSFIADKGLLSEVVVGKRPLWIHDLQDYSTVYRTHHFHALGLRTCMMFPVQIDREVIAIFEFFATDILQPDQPLLDITVQIADQLSRVMEREQHLRALQASEQRFRQLFEAVPIPLIITREADGRIVETNDVFVPLLNDNIKSLIGTDRLTFFESEHDLTALQHEIELAVRAPNGERGWILLSTQRIMYQGESSRLSGFVDISERKHAEESERQQRALAESLRDSAAVLLNSTLNIDSVLNHIFSQIKLAIPHDAGTILLFDEDEVLRIAHTRASDDIDFPADIQGRAVDADIENLRHMRMKGVPYIVNDASIFEDWNPILGVDWIQSNVGAPLRTANDTIGFITLEGSRPYTFTGNHAQFLQAFANLAATAIQNARLYDALNRHANLLEQRVEDRTQKLRESKEYAETILNNTSDALVQIDREYRVLQTNPAFDSTFLLQIDEHYAHSIFELVDQEDVDRFKNTIQNVQSSHQAAQIELTAQRRDGSQFIADVDIAPIATDLQAISHFICSFHDISRQKQIEQSLRNAVEEERNLRELKSRFISMATHEFRTPLTIMGMYLSLINQKIDAEIYGPIRDHSDNIHEQLLYVEQLMDEVLAVEQSESTVAHVNDECFNLREFATQMVKDLQQSSQSGHQIVLQISGDYRDITIDKKILRHIISNLISNAIKYSPDAADIYVDLSITYHQAVLQVRDTGIGIPKEDQARLFEPFHRARNVGDISGTGLGLAVIKRHVEIQGGSIAFESAVGEGTTFTISLPRNVTEASAD
jgi:PAS domain S-box-containing protein